MVYFTFMQHKSTAIRQFLADVVWGELEFMIVDLPPGTGDKSLSIMQFIPEIDGVVIVTIPSKVSQLVVKKAVTFTRQLNAPVIGVVENMSGFICPKCGARVTHQAGVPCYSLTCPNCGAQIIRVH